MNAEPDQLTTIPVSMLLFAWRYLFKQICYDNYTDDPRTKEEDAAPQKPYKCSLYSPAQKPEAVVH